MLLLIIKPACFSDTSAPPTPLPLNPQELTLKEIFIKNEQSYKRGFIRGITKNGNMTEAEATPIADCSYNYIVKNHQWKTTDKIEDLNDVAVDSLTYCIE